MEHPYCTEHDQPLDWCKHEDDRTITLDVMLAHLIKMRSVHRAVGYNVDAETRGIAALRAKIKERDAHDV